MSADEQGGAGRREVAYRLFAAEYEDADFSYSESDEERAPNYVVTPTGARVNRLFVVGVLTELEQVNDEVVRARVVDPTGAFVVYAGQYQPDQLAFLERASPPTFVAVTGKARTFQPEDSDTVYTSIRPESINEVDAETRDRWTVHTVERTLHRISTMAGALESDLHGDELTATLVADGVDEGLAAGTALAVEHYRTTPTYLNALRETALDAARVVTGDLDEVRSVEKTPDESGTATPAELTDVDSTVDQSADHAAARDDPPAATSGGAAADAGTSDPSDVSTSTGTTPTDSSGATEQTESTGETEATAAEKSSTTDSTDNSMDAGVTATAPSADEPADEVGDFEPGEFDLDEEEREKVESEYGTEFETGTEVDEPGEAGIETPEAGQQDDSPAETEGETAAESAPDSTGEMAAESPSEPATEAGETGDAEPASGGDGDDVSAEERDLEEAVMDVMREHNGDDGAEKDTVVDAVVDQYGVAADEVEDAIQDALMDGRCYEPDETTLKPI